MKLYEHLKKGVSENILNAANRQLELLMEEFELQLKEVSKLENSDREPIQVQEIDTSGDEETQVDAEKLNNSPNMWTGEHFLASSHTEFKENEKFQVEQENSKTEEGNFQYFSSN